MTTDDLIVLKNAEKLGETLDTNLIEKEWTYLYTCIKGKQCVSAYNSTKNNNFVCSWTYAN